ncbi:MAG: adenosylhomocysteinase [Microbacteriaceae bacterium]
MSPKRPRGASDESGQHCGTLFICHEKLALKLTTLTAAQASYIGVDVAGPFTVDQHRY